MSATAHYALVPDKHSNHGLPIEPRNGRSTAGDIALLRRAPPCYEMNTSRLLSQFRISAAMRPYVLRVRLRGWDFDFGSNPEAAAAFTARIGEMRRILVARRISVVAADRAILKTMEAAIDFQLAELRYRSLKTIEAQSQDTLNSLIQGLRKLSDAIAQLPPTPKGELNKRVSAILRQGIFRLRGLYRDRRDNHGGPSWDRAASASRQCLFNSSSRTGRRQAPADNRPVGSDAGNNTRDGRRSDATSQALKSLVQWLNRLVDLLGRERPARKRGAPRSISQAFVSRTAAIWQTLGLNAGLAYDFFLHPATGGEFGAVGAWRAVSNAIVVRL